MFTPLPLSLLFGAAMTALPAMATTVPRPGDAMLAVQMNQVALERHGPKTAVVEYRGSAMQGRYRVLRNATQVGDGALRALPAFTAWTPGQRYFDIDYSAFTEPGEYRIVVEVDGQTVTSSPVQVGDNALFRVTAGKLIEYFQRSRHTSAADRRIRIFGTDRFVDVWGGWNDAGGDNGKYLSHLMYAHFFTPQQASLAAWVLAKTAHGARPLYQQAGLADAAVNEAFWGADYLHRILDRQGYFYVTVFDKWGTEKAERMVTGYEGIDGVYTDKYRAAFRAGGGMAIAALARASMLAKQTGQHGEFNGETYLRDAIRAFDHLQANNAKYCSDGVENIIDDYTALMAATELFQATRQPRFLAAARTRAGKLSARLHPKGYFVSDRGDRPYYHGAEAGLPVISLAYYHEIETGPRKRALARQTIATALAHQLALNRRVANPYNYPRQQFRTYQNGALSNDIGEGFFMPHKNETGYWWQGESARLSSLSTAALLGGRVAAADPAGAFGIKAELAQFAQHQVDWTLGRNPYGMSMLYGFGSRNPPSAESAGSMFAGGISNGITGAADSPDGAGIDFAVGPDENQWRWVEQWLPHTAWMLLNAVSMADR